MNRSPGATRRARILALLFGLLLVGLVEAGLRLAGLGGMPPLTLPLFAGGGAERSGLARLHEVNPRFTDPFFPRPVDGGAHLAGGHRREVVEVPKPAGRLRVVLVGESTLEGFPHPRNLTAAAFLAAWLREALPGRDVEVLNLGIAGVASFPVAITAEAALRRLEPDVLVVYSGHNELYGAGGVASHQRLGASPRRISAAWAVRRLALADLLAPWVERSDAAPADATGHRPQLIEVMAAGAVAPESPLRRQAVATLDAHLRRLARAARQAEVPLVLCTVASNLRDLVPVGGGAALAVYAEARQAELAGEDERAAARYRAARELDPMPWRAVAALDETIRAAAERSAEEAPSGAPLVLADVAAAFERDARAAGEAAPGWRLFEDHVHPTLEGQALLARTLVESFARRRLLGLDPATPARLRPWQRVAAELGASPLERLVAAHAMQTLFRTPPFARHNHAAAERFGRIVAALERSAGTDEREALRRWRRGSVRAGFALPISYFAAAAAIRRGRLDQARQYLVGAVASAPVVSDERAAALYLEAVRSRLAGESSSHAAFARADAEASLVARRAGPPSALLVATRDGLRRLDGGDSNAPAAAGEASRAAPATPWGEAFRAELPPPEVLARLPPAAPAP